MIAFDTNVLVRIAVNDDQAQADIALRLLENNEVFVSRTVLLESEWVLRSVYKKSVNEIADFFENLIYTENISIENIGEVENAIKWYRLGADFADSMHLSVCTDIVMHTFDKNYCKSAYSMGLTPELKII